MSAFIQHGGALDAAIAAHGGTLADWLDLSTGINPRPYPIPALPEHVWQRLPQEADMFASVNAAKSYYRVPGGAELVAGPGTQAIIQWLPYLWPGRSAVIAAPTYGEYDRVFQLAGHGVRHVADFDGSSVQNSVVFIGNPNNPDGRVWQREDCETLLARGAVLVIDEAFADVAPEVSLIDLADRENVLVLKSFGKFFGLAGVRLGFAIGQGDLPGRLDQMLGPWSVPGPALTVGTRAISDVAWIADTRRWLAGQRARLDAMLDDMGFEPVGATDLFITVSHKKASAIYESLLSQRILVRPFDYAPTWLRFGLPQTQSALERLKKSLERAVP
ncbi:MAG: threonine-phosphate decarboxylase CobD [Pseudomonadota bacterium]